MNADRPHTRRRRLAEAVILVGLTAVWWWPVSTWVDKPGTYRVGGAFGAVVLVALTLNLTARRRYSRMYRATLAAAWAGVAEPGAITYSANQRLRYTVRVLEDVLAAVVAVLALVAVAHPQVATHPWYTKVILTFLFGTVIVTAYLTWRDLRTLAVLRKLDSGTDAAELRPIVRAGRRGGRRASDG